MNEQSPVPALPAARAPVPWRAREGIALWFTALLATLVPAFVGVEGNALVVALIWVNEGMLLGLTLLWVRARYDAGVRELGYGGTSKEDVKHGLAVGGGGILASFLIGAAVLWLAERIAGSPVEPPKQIDLKASPDIPTLVLIGIGVVVLAPIAEELFFRGFVHSAIRRFAAPMPAAMLSGFVFALVHIHPLVIPSIFVLGVMLAVAFEHRGNVIPSIVAHMAFNGFAFGVYLWQGAPV